MKEEVFDSTTSFDSARWTAGEYANEFVKNPAAIVGVLRAFWKRLNEQVYVAEFDFHWEFHIASPFEAEPLFMELERVNDAMSTAALKNEVVNQVMGMFGWKILRYHRVLAELMSDLRSRTDVSFPELCDLIEVLTAADGANEPTRQPSTEKKRASSSTKKPEPASKRWMRWILANFQKREMQGRSNAAVIEHLTGSRKNSTISDYLNRKKWAAPSNSDYEKAQKEHGPLNSLEYSDYM